MTITFATPNPTPTKTVVLTHEVWQLRKQMNSSRPTRQLVGAIGEPVTEDQAKAWGVGKKSANEGFYFVPPPDEVEVVTADELMARAEKLDIQGRLGMGLNQLRDAVVAAEGGHPAQATTVPDPKDGTQGGTNADPPEKLREVKTTAVPGPGEGTQTQERKGPRRGVPKE